MVFSLITGDLKKKWKKYIYKYRSYFGIIDFILKLSIYEFLPQLSDFL